MIVNPVRYGSGKAKKTKTVTAYFSASLATSIVIYYILDGAYKMAFPDAYTNSKQFEVDEGTIIVGANGVDEIDGAQKNDSLTRVNLFYVKPS